MDIRNEAEIQRMLEETKKFLKLLAVAVSSATIGAIVARLIP